MLNMNVMGKIYPQLAPVKTKPVRRKKGDTVTSKLPVNANTIKVIITALGHGEWVTFKQIRVATKLSTATISRAATFLCRDKVTVKKVDTVGQATSTYLKLIKG